MDRIEFVVGERQLGVGPSICAEPVINGHRLEELLRPGDRETSGYAGQPPQMLFAELRRGGQAADVQVLRCVCGDDGCSWVVVQVISGPGEVLWRNFRASHTDTSTCARVGPFRFDRGQYERALAESTPT